MNPNSKWITATITWVVVALMMPDLFPPVFADGADQAQQSEGRIDSTASPEKLPTRPAIMAQNTPPQLPRGQTITVVSRTMLPAVPPRPQQTRSKSKTWIAIIAAAAGAGVAAVMLTRGDGSDDVPSAKITVGSPTVGQPQ